jgi:hypothetical protein
MPPYVLPDEIHNEDAHYSRLAIGFLLNNDEQRLPLSFTDPELELLLFPDLFPDGHGHYGDLHNQSLANNNNALTYGKYVKARLIGYDAHFRLHPVWIMWSYMQLEKIRNFQNTAQIRRQRTADITSSQSSAFQSLRQSHYTNQMIIDEDKSIPLPTFIRTGDSYFREKEHHLNAMVKAKGLPSLFVTLSMAETKWKHLKEILRRTDNGDINPTNPASEKRALLYSSLTETSDKPSKKLKASTPTDNNNSSKPNTNTSTEPILIPEDNSVEQPIQPKPHQPRKITLRSTTKISNIATNKLDFSNIHDESE